MLRSKTFHKIDAGLYVTSIDMIRSGEGVIRVMEILKVEMERAMGLLGVGNIKDLKEQGRDLIKRRLGSSRDGQGARYSRSGII